MGKVIETVADAITIEILDKNIIITGKGNELHLFEKNVSKENMASGEQVLDIKLNNKIHGIRKGADSNANILLVYGEKEFVLLQYDNNYKFQKLYRAELSDWISSAAFLKDRKEFVLLTAHSIILRFEYNVENKLCLLKERISCTDKSTLYCAHLYGDTWNELVVFAGNAFGELLIWQPVNRKVENGGVKSRESILIHRISAHNGVIFSIDYDRDTNMLITTSDDRAIKWWKVKFTDCVNKDIDWSDSSLQAMASGYGHVARVFQGRIIKDGPHVYALSVGEDSYFCLWHSNGQLLFKRRQQYGATLWNFVYENNTKTIYTIGSRGNLVAYGLKEILKETQQPHNDILLAQVAEENPTEYIGKVKFLTENQLIGITNQNRIMTMKIQGEDNDDRWQPIDIVMDFKSTVMEVYANVIAICGFKRVLLIEWQEEKHQFVKLYDQHILKSVIRTFVFFTKHQYLISDDRGNCLIFMDSLDKQRSLELPKCKEPWLTTALLLNQQQHIVISNRQGNLLLYKLSEDESIYTLQNIIKHPHGNLGATQLQYLDTNIDTVIIRSSGHDGAINFFSINFTDSTIKACSRQIIPVSWVENIESWRKNLDIYLGFNDNHFVVWCREYDFLIQLPCGGGHRCWHFIINPNDNQILLVFIKNKRVRFYKLPLMNKELTKLPLAKRWHIAPCNVMEILSNKWDKPENSIVVTAGDDNLLKIHTYSQLGLEEQKELHNHISNIKALKVLSINDKEFLIFSGGGRAQLCITRVNKQNFHIEELVNYTLKQECNSNKSLNNKTYNFDPETRLMSLDVKVLPNNEYHLYIGCSDGFIRQLSFNLLTLQVELLTQYFYNKCLLQIKYISDKDYVLSATTDGLLKVFNASLERCLYEMPHHASGINGLSILYDSSLKTLQILTGGDDQAVSYTKLSLENFTILNTFHRPYLHTAQVCAAAISDNGLFGFTSGVDQNLYKLDLSTGEVVESFHSCVADIKGVGLINDATTTCLLYGCGLQIYAFNDS